MKIKNNSHGKDYAQKNFSELAALLIFLFSLLYTAGWSFAYHYFAHFNVGLSALELSKEEYFIYSYWVIADHKSKFFVSYSNYMEVKENSAIFEK